MDILAALYTLREQAEHGEVEHPKYGICLNLWLLTHINDLIDFIVFVGNCAEDWDGYSGHKLYPIGGRSEYYQTGRLWTGLHLKQRLSLIGHIIQKVEEGECFLFEDED